MLRRAVLSLSYGEVADSGSKIRQSLRPRRSLREHWYRNSRNIQNKRSSKHGFPENPRPFWTQDLVFFGFLVLKSSILGLQNEEFKNLKTQNYEKVAGSISPI